MDPIKIRIGRGVFAPRLGPTLITLLCLPILIGLGTWQVQRLHWKQHLLAEIVEHSRDAPMVLPLPEGMNADYRPAKASGTFQHNGQLSLFATNIATGEGGYHIFTPLQFENGQYLLVDRGWAPYMQKPDSYGKNADGQKIIQKLGGISQPRGKVNIHGILRLPQKPGRFSPVNNPAKGEWYNVDLTEIAKADHINAFLPYILEADAMPSDSAYDYPIGGQTRLSLPNDHFSYAVTWYSFAAILLIIFGLSSYRADSRASASKEVSRPPDV